MRTEVSGCGFVADQRAQSRQRHRATNHPSVSPFPLYQLLPRARNDGNDRTLLSLWPRAVAAPRLEYFSNFCASKFKPNVLAVKQPNWLTTLRMRDVRLQQHVRCAAFCHACLSAAVQWPRGYAKDCAQ